MDELTQNRIFLNKDLNIHYVDYRNLKVQWSKIVKGRFN